MRIYAFVDLHADKKALRKIVARSKKKDIDLVVSAGDHSIFGSGEKEILKELNSIEKPVLMIHGNHEDAGELKKTIKKYKNLHFIHGNYYRKNNHLFIGWGGGGFSYRNKKFEEKFDKFGKWIKKEDTIILITHQPCYGTKIDKIHGEYAGSKTVKKFIDKYKPLVAISGHLHETAGKMDKKKKTLIINPGYEGKVLEI